MKGEKEDDKFEGKKENCITPTPSDARVFLC